MEVGKLYRIQKYAFLLYSSIDDAKECDIVFAKGDKWHINPDNRFSDLSEKSLVMLLEKNGIYYKVLSIEGQLGWIINHFHRLEECSEEMKAE